MTLPVILAAAVEIAQAIAIGAVSLGVVAGGAVAVIDRMQKKDALRHKFPVLARFIKPIDWLGEFWRSHGGAGDRQEMPFNRDQRKALTRYGENKPNVIGFGSSNNLRMPGTPLFINAAFPPANPGDAPPMVATTLVKHELKDRIRIIAAGKLVEASRVAWALAAGADFINSARGFMIGGLGCIQAKQCHNNTCPKGITTNNPELAERLNIEKQAEATASLCKGMRHDVDMIAHSCGVDHARLLRPRHVTIVMPDSQSKRLSDLYPGLKF